VIKRPHLLFEHYLCPGDVTAMTVVPRDVYRAVGSDVVLSVRTSYPELFQNNPFIKHNLPKGVPADPSLVRCPLKYDVKASAAGDRHFLHTFIDAARPYVSPYLKQPLELTEFRPSLWLSEEEAIPPKLPDQPKGAPYWLVMSGGKHDIKTKLWAPRRWRNVVYELAQDKDFPALVQVGMTSTGHTHRPLPGCIDMLDQTNLRQLIRLARHARGIICGVTALMHIAAAVGTPAVVIAGGREPWWWDSYDSRAQAKFRREYTADTEYMRGVHVPHVYLTGGEARCVDNGCWNVGFVENQEGKNCKNLLPADRINRSIPQPTCMEAITPTVVLECARQMDKEIAACSAT